MKKSIVLIVKMAANYAKNDREVIWMQVFNKFYMLKNSEIFIIQFNMEHQLFNINKEKQKNKFYK